MRFKKFNAINLEQPHTVSSRHNKKEWLNLVRNESMLCTYGKYAIRLEVKKPYGYDGASVPRAAWTLIGITPFGNAKLPALPHDIVYIYGGDVNKINSDPLISITITYTGRHVKKISRKLSDELFGAMLIYAGYRPRQARWAYRALRVGARGHWGRGPGKK